MPTDRTASLSIRAARANRFTALSGPQRGVVPQTHSLKVPSPPQAQTRTCSPFSVSRVIFSGASLGPFGHIELITFRRSGRFGKVASAENSDLFRLVLSAGYGICNKQMPYFSLAISGVPRFFPFIYINKSHLIMPL